MSFDTILQDNICSFSLTKLLNLIFKTLELRLFSRLYAQIQFAGRRAALSRILKTITLQCWACESWPRWRISCVWLETKLTRLWTKCRLRQQKKTVRWAPEIHCSPFPLSPTLLVQNILWNGSKRARKGRSTNTLAIVSSPGNRNG